MRPQIAVTSVHRVYNRAAVGGDMYGAGADGSVARLHRVSRLPSSLPGHRPQLFPDYRRTVDSRRPSTSD